MASSMFDSAVYSGAWSAPEVRSLFDEERKLGEWLKILVAFAEAQSELQLISRAQADEIRRIAVTTNLDLKFLQADYERTGHSLHGMLLNLQRHSQPGLAPLMRGMTVQDLTDTWLALTMKRLWCSFFSSSLQMEELLLDLSARYSSAAMAGRTHGQPGVPVTFGFKCAVWAAEWRRHLARFREIFPRINIGQLCGNAGAASAFGDKGLILQRLFLKKLGLNAPAISWTSSRDQVAEFMGLLSQVSVSLARIGNEIYNLQKPEIGELEEGLGEENVGSITMPHKRNPEISEHLATLSRAVRARVSALAESLVHDHERDGRSWKAEWLEVPEIAMLVSSGLAKGLTVVRNLRVHETVMMKNLLATNGYIFSEAAFAVLKERLSEEKARTAMYRICKLGKQKGLTLQAALQQDAEAGPLLAAEDLEKIFSVPAQIKMCQEMIAHVRAEAASRRAQDVQLLNEVKSQCLN